MQDVIVVGGSYAGMSAALQLVRARRKVLVVDGGQRRNRYAKSSHGFLTQDGRSPVEIAQRGRADVEAYPTLTWVEQVAVQARAVSEGFVVTLASGESHAARRLILASGVTDELPEIPGIAERWGHSIFHCPYCHGYELNQGRIGLLATSPLSVHPTLLLADWGEVTYFTRGAFEPSQEQLSDLLRRRITIERAPVVAVSGQLGKTSVHLEDGGELEFAGLFVPPSTRLSSSLAEQLGCSMEAGPTGPYVKTDATKETNVVGVFACGDMSLPAGAVVLAVADGARAGFSAHQSLVFRN